MIGWLYLLKRVAQAVLTVLVLMSLLFVILHASGDPAKTLSGPNATAAQVQAATIRLGLDRSWWAQYGAFLSDVVRGQFGTSYTLNEPAMMAVLDRLPASLAIVLPAMVITFAFAMLLGSFAGFRPNSNTGKVFLYGTFFGQAIPFFWLALVLVLLFAVKVHFFPASGSGSVAAVVLPVVAVAASNTATLARLVRGEVFDVLRRPFVIALQSKGISTKRLLVRHVWPNVLPMVNSWLAILFAFTIGELVVIEPLFNYNGLGNLLVQAVTANDFPLVEAGVFVVAILVVVGSLLVDLANRALDPSLRHRVEAS